MRSKVARALECDLPEGRQVTAPGVEDRNLEVLTAIIEAHGTPICWVLRIVELTTAG